MTARIFFHNLNLNYYEELIVIDGQQRLTTTLIFISALRNRMRTKSDANKYILNGENYRLIPSYLDRPAFYSIIDSTENSNLQGIKIIFDMFHTVLTPSKNATINQKLCF